MPSRQWEPQPNLHLLWVEMEGDGPLDETVIRKRTGIDPPPSLLVFGLHCLKCENIAYTSTAESQGSTRFRA